MDFVLTDEEKITFTKRIIGFYSFRITLFIKVSMHDIAAQAVLKRVAIMNSLQIQIL